MLFGINTFLWASPFTTAHIPLIKKAKDMGFDLIELPIEGMEDIDYVKAGAAIKDAGLKVSVCAIMGATRDPAHDDPAIQRGGIDYLKHCIDATVTMGGNCIGGPIYAAVGRTWQSTPEQRKRELERCAKNLKVVAKYAEDKGVVLGMEPLNRFESSFINIVDQALELIDMVDSPSIQMMLDTFHMNVEEKHFGPAIEKAGKHLVHVHANENDRGIPGSGHVPWNEVAAALKKINFDGAMVIESFSTTVKEIARAAAIWRPPSPDPDMLARDGQAFLRKLMA